MTIAKTYTSRASAVRGLKRAGYDPLDCVVTQMGVKTWIYVTKSELDKIEAAKVEESFKEEVSKMKDTLLKTEEPTKEVKAKKERKSVKIQNDIRNRERTGSIGYACWELFYNYLENSASLPDNAYAEKVAKDNNWKPITVKTELYDWKRYNGHLENVKHKQTKAS